MEAKSIGPRFSSNLREEVSRLRSYCQVSDTFSVSTVSENEAKQELPGTTCYLSRIIADDQPLQINTSDEAANRVQVLFLRDMQIHPLKRWSLNESRNLILPSYTRDIVAIQTLFVASEFFFARAVSKLL